MNRPKNTARTLWITSAVFFGAAIATLFLRQDDAALILAGIAFALVYFVESNFDWQQRITRSNWKRTVVESRAQTTLLGKLAQVMAMICIIGSLLVGRH